MAGWLESKLDIQQRTEIQMSWTSFDHRRNCWIASVTAFVCAAILANTPTAVWPQSVKTQEDAGRVLAVEKLVVNDGTISGAVINRSSRLVRDVQLFIRYTWLWDDEMKPGKLDPGTSTYYTLQKEIPPGGRLPFTFQPSPPLAKIGGGRYETSVSIAGFTEVILQGK
jgi:hypothetical protein